MKKVKNTLSSASSKVTGRKCAAVFSASLFAFTSVTCAAQFAESDAISEKYFGVAGQKIILELSESYLSPNADNNISVLEVSSDLFTLPSEESETIQLIHELPTDSETETKNVSEGETEEVLTEEEKTTEKAVETTAAQATETKPEASAAQQMQTQAVEAAVSGGYTFAQLGITQMSDIPVPDTILFDENGIPLNYSYKLTGRATAYNMGTTTATGTSVHPGVVAVNPNIIPYGSKMYIVASDGSGYVYGYSSAEDTGGFIYWNNAPIVDMYVYSYNDACLWGNRPVTIYVF